MNYPARPVRISDFFPKGRTPRTAQLEVLTQVEKHWDDADVFVIDMPVGAGKSYTGVTILRWAMNAQKMKGRLLTPQNLLVQQYKRDFPDLHTLPAAHSFTCLDSIKRDSEGQILESHSCAKEKQRGEKTYCSNCPYLKEKKKGYAMPYGVYNLYTYIANQYHRPLLVIDEAHNVVNTLRDFNARKFWQSEYGFPSSIRTYGQLHQWLVKSISSFSGPKAVRLSGMLKELEGNRTKAVVQKTTDLLRGQEEEVIKLLPVDVRNAGGILWPSKKVNKLVLMSATINRMDIESLGLDKRRVRFISAASPIPPSQRPIYIDRSGINLAFKYQDLNLGKLVAYLEGKLKEFPNEKGLIHVTYSLMQKLQLNMQDPRLIFHSKEDKKDKYNEFLTSKEPKVLVAAGLYEGIDLPEDLGRWQVLTKVPFPSLESPAISWMAESNEEWYANETIRIIAQASGRICRTETDFGRTFIVDSNFERLYSNNRDLFPQWFIDGVVE